MVERRRTIFPVVFTNYHQKIGKVFADNADEFFSIARGIKDFRYINISIEMGMIASLIMIANGTENLQNLESSLTDYYKNISHRGNEAPEEKKQRIYVANSALMNVVKCLYQILCFDICKKALLENEYSLLSDWLFNARELFPRNISDKKTRHHDNHDHDHKQNEDDYSQKNDAYATMFPPPAPVTHNPEASVVKKPSGLIGAWRAPNQEVVA
jgi:hypothetical protein